MKGGFNNPPNQLIVCERDEVREASMKGGFNNPPNTPKWDDGPHLNELQ